MKKKYLESGKIVSMHGLVGEVKVQPWCDSPEFLKNFDFLYTDDGKTKLEVESCRTHKNMTLIKFKGYDKVEDTQLLKNKVLYIDRDDDNLQEGDYYVQDLQGLEVRNADTNEIYGKLTEVSQTGANDVYHILFADGKERLVPAIPQVIISVDIENDCMLIRPLEGLFDDEN